MKFKQFCVACVIVVFGLTSFHIPERVVISLPGDEVSRARMAECWSETPLPVTDPNTDPLIIPLKRAGRLYLFDATVDGESGNFIFDSGSKEVVLNCTYFRNRLKSAKVNSSGITGALDQVSEITVSSLIFQGLEYKNLTVHMAGLGHIETKKGVKILGLAGFNLFRKHETVIDPVNNELRLYRIDADGNRTGNTQDFIPDEQQKIGGSGNVLFLKGTVGNKLMNFCFDTAAETNVISSHSGKQVLNTLTITRRTTLKGAGQSTAEVLFGKMNDFNIGNHKITGMETVIANLSALTETYDTHIDGILGGSFLEHGTVCVNFVKSRIGISFTKENQK
jgi:hypothetical protein